MNGNERSVQKMNGNERNVLNGNERDAQPWCHVIDVETYDMPYVMSHVSHT